MSQISINRDDIMKQLGFRRVCTGCEVQKELKKTLRNFNCPICGKCYDEVGVESIFLTKKMIRAEFYEHTGLSLDDGDTDRVFNACIQARQIAFSRKLQLVIMGTKERLELAKR